MFCSSSLRAFVALLSAGPCSAKKSSHGGRAVPASSEVSGLVHTPGEVLPVGCNLSTQSHLGDKDAAIPCSPLVLECLQRGNRILPAVAYAASG